MKKYKVEIVRESAYVVDVIAKDITEAMQKAHTKWCTEIVPSGTEHCYEHNDMTEEIGDVYDVTNTDDPFNP